MKPPGVLEKAAQKIGSGTESQLSETGGGGLLKHYDIFPDLLEKSFTLERVALGPSTMEKTTTRPSSSPQRKGHEQPQEMKLLGRSANQSAMRLFHTALEAILQQSDVVEILKEKYFPPKPNHQIGG